ncbi:MAG: hypothetical protein OQK78_05850 [Gammaproteobacteria bacterium]|nr:hypothetical protein [Gammaproteobacteria bacterium]
MMLGNIVANRLSCRKLFVARELVYSNPEKYGKYGDHAQAPFTSTSSTYSRTGGTLYKTTTYHSGQMGLWWRGSAVGAFELSLIDSVGLDRMLK